MATELEYLFLETSIVTDEELTRIVNHAVAEGWNLDGIHFAMRDASRRPAMAFLAFTRPRDDPDREKST